MKSPDNVKRLHYCMRFQSWIEESGINMLDTAYCSDKASFPNLMDTSRVRTARCGQVKIHTRYIKNPYLPHPKLYYARYLSDAQLVPSLNRRYTHSVKLSDFTVWRHTWQKDWVNCEVLAGNSTGLRTVLSSRLSHTELCSSLREYHSFLSLPADTTMASSQGTSISSNSFQQISIARYIPFQIPLLTAHFTLSFLLFG